VDPQARWLWQMLFHRHTIAVCVPVVARSGHRGDERPPVSLDPTHTRGEADCLSLRASTPEHNTGTAVPSTSTLSHMLKRWREQFDPGPDVELPASKRCVVNHPGMTSGPSIGDVADARVVLLETDLLKSPETRQRSAVQPLTKDVETLKPMVQFACEQHSDASVPLELNHMVRGR
jgi:hypothetical protein